MLKDLETLRSIYLRTYINKDCNTQGHKDLMTQKLRKLEEEIRYFLYFCKNTSIDKNLKKSTLKSLT